jgi:hypothetical protein
MLAALHALLVTLLAALRRYWLVHWPERQLWDWLEH